MFGFGSSKKNQPAEKSEEEKQKEAAEHARN